MIILYDKNLKINGAIVKKFCTVVKNFNRQKLNTFTTHRYGVHIPCVT